jgi:hypothetical protein
VRNDITSRSRRWSIGGLVTCANRCFKKLKIGRALVATAANGVSSPIENVGSLPSVAIGLSTIATSSRVIPNAASERRRSSAHRVDRRTHRSGHEAVGRPPAVGLRCPR